MRTFLIVWFGQLLSMLGTSLTGFALAVWVYEARGSVTQLALISVSAVLPGMLVAPWAGPLIDRWDRRWAMLLSDLVAGLSTSGMAALFLSERLDLWHIYAAVGINSVCMAIQMPAWAAATTLLVPSEALARASGMVQMGQAAALLVGPALAGALMHQVGVLGILAMDAVSFCVGVLVLLAVRFPSPDAPAPRSSWRSEVAVSWAWIRRHPGMVRLLAFGAASNLCLGMVHVLITPLVLGFADASVLGLVMSTGGAGMLVGSVIMVAWGGPERKILGVVCFSLAQGALLLLGGLRPSVWLVMVGAFGALLAFPIIQACTQTIWQLKVPPELQGRVFSVRNAVVASTLPLAYLMAGPLADHLFEPLLASGGALSDTLGQVLGTGRGRGIGLLFVVLGVTAIGIAVAALMHPRVRRVEVELPDQTGTSGGS